MSESSATVTARLAAGRNRRWPLAVPTALVWATLFVVPVALLLLFSFGRIDPLTYKVSFGWTLNNYSKLLEPIYTTMLLRSVLIAVASALLCLIVGFPTAYFISRCHGRLQQLLLLAVIIPFWVSFIVRTYAWLVLLQRKGLVNQWGQALGLWDETNPEITTIVVQDDKVDVPAWRHAMTPHGPTTGTALAGRAACPPSVGWRD